MLRSAFCFELRIRAPGDIGQTRPGSFASSSPPGQTRYKGRQSAKAVYRSPIAGD